MVRANTKLKPLKGLEVVKEVKTTKYSDINLNEWRNYLRR